VNLSDKILEYLNQENFDSFNDIIRGWSCYIRICDSAVACVRYYGLDIRIDIYHSKISQDSIWIYKDFIYFVENLKQTILEIEDLMQTGKIELNIDSSIFSHSRLYGSYYSKENDLFEEIWHSEIQ